jgi:cell division protein FtsQ
MDRPEGFSAGAQRASSSRSTRVTTPSPDKRVRVASKARVSAEKAEYRRFTEATRRRRLTWLVSLGSVGLLVLSVVVLTLSPALALREVRVEGASRVTADAIVEVLGDFYGEPLARINDERVAAALEPLTLIHSVETRIEPPGTLVVTIHERRPLGAVAGRDAWEIVDAAGVVLWEEPGLPAGLPQILVAASPDSPSFRAISRVLLALPDDLLAQVEGITATTLDDVRFTIRGSSHEVVWGSSERSVEKARVLGASLIALGNQKTQIIDVTTPDSVVVRQRG